MRQRLYTFGALLIALLPLSAGCNALTDVDQFEEEALEDLFLTASPLCMNYCAESARACKGDNTLFEDDAQCVTTCQDYPIGGLPEDLGGDTIQCRLSHLQLAALGDANRHCPHASAAGGGVCTGIAPCQEYCGLFLETCNPSTRDFQGPQDCVMRCASFDQSIPNTPIGEDTVQCRLAWLKGPPDSAQCLESGPMTCTPPPPGSAGLGTAP